MTSYQQRPGGKFLAVDRRGNKHENQIIAGSLYEFSRPRFREGDLGGNRGFVYIGLKLFDLNRELLTNNIREESFWRWIEEELTRK